MCCIVLCYSELARSYIICSHGSCVQVVVISGVIGRGAECPSRGFRQGNILGTNRVKRGKENRLKIENLEAKKMRENGKGKEENEEKLKN